jgi:V8-like Glu-specific endopeptidase
MIARWFPRQLEIVRVALFAFAATVACSACTAPVAANGSDGADGAGGSDSKEKTGTAQQAIVNGDDDDSDPAVVALMLNGSVYCTGVLLTNNVVATAAHCVTPTPPDQVYFGNDPSTKKKGTFIDVTTTRVHPDFDEDTLVNDIAVIGLAATAPTAPLNIFVKEFDDSYIGLEIRLIGFGATGPDQTDNLRKHTGTTAITSYTDDDFRFRPAPSQTCVGDSGGPAVARIGDHEAVIGLTSSGDSNCMTYGRDMRIDRYLPFIQGYAKAYSIPTGPKTVDSSGCSMTGASRSNERSSFAGGLLLVLACAAATRSRLRKRQLES